MGAMSRGVAWGDLGLGMKQVKGSAYSHVSNAPGRSESLELVGVSLKAYILPMPGALGIG